MSAGQKGGKMRECEVGRSTANADASVLFAVASSKIITSIGRPRVSCAVSQDNLSLGPSTRKR